MAQAQLKGKHIFQLSRCIKAMHLELKVDELDLKDPKSAEKFSSRLLDQLLSNMGDAEKEASALFGDILDKTPQDVLNQDLFELMDELTPIFMNERFSDFFKRAAVLGRKV